MEPFIGDKSKSAACVKDMGDASLKTAARIFVDRGIVVLLALFAFSLLYLRTGSLEMVPTEEDQGKALVVAVLGMIVAGTPLRCVHQPPGRQPAEKAGAVDEGSAVVTLQEPVENIPRLCYNETTIACKLEDTQ